ncbi:hypothetical protein NST33_20805 [Paenibacillus sp. FSL L8-0435]|uniref:hypothetical protein n=1 Tax=Paenibacillus sp. FSL L8-0435 TaxID=2954618 RepID=UPI0030DAC45F
MIRDADRIKLLEFWATLTEQQRDAVVTCTNQLSERLQDAVMAVTSSLEEKKETFAKVWEQIKEFMENDE